MGADGGVVVVEKRETARLAGLDYVMQTFVMASSLADSFIISSLSRAPHKSIIPDTHIDSM